MASNRDMISHFKKKAYGILGTGQADHGRWEELREKYLELVERYKRLADDLTKNEKQLPQYDQECRRLYRTVGPVYEEYTILQTIFSGEGSIPYYVDYFMDVCRRRAPVKEDAESAELFAYKNILSMIRMKLEDVKEKLQKIPAYDDPGFESYYDIRPVEDMTESTHVYVVIDVSGMADTDYERLRKTYVQMREDFVRLEKANKECEETLSYLCRIQEEWNNRKEYLDSGKAREYQILYQKLQEIPWDEYALREEEDADTYKGRLLELAGMLKGLAEIIS